MKKKLMTLCGTLLCLGLIAGAASAEPVVWDTVATSSAWDTGVPTGSGENIALSVANNGEMGQMGVGGVNLDFTIDGGETGTSPADRIYLRSGSLFLMRNDGDSVLLTTSIAQKDWASAAEYDSISYDFIPVPEGGPMSSGIGLYTNFSEREFDSVYSGRFVSRDSTVAVERVYYAPLRKWYDSYRGNILIVRTRLFTNGKGPQGHLSVGDVIDWDVPSDVPGKNTSWPTHIYHMGDATVIQGTNEPVELPEADNTARLAMEPILGSYNATGSWYWTCKGMGEYHGSLSVPASFVEESPESGEPDAAIWWDSVASHDNSTGLTTESDQITFMTYRHDFDLADSDTLVFFTGLVVLREGSVSDLMPAAKDALMFYWNDFAGCTGPGCCAPPTVGDVDWSFVVDITDLSIMIDNQFLTLTPLNCPDEADLDFNDIVDITDIMIMIDHLFISLQPLSACW